MCCAAIANDQRNRMHILINDQFAFRFIRMRKLAAELFLKIRFPLTKRGLLECLND